MTTCKNTPSLMTSLIHFLFLSVCVVNYVTALTSDEAAKVPENREKRYSSFVRIGKGGILNDKDDAMSKLSSEVDALTKLTSEVEDMNREADDSYAKAEEMNEELEREMEMNKKASSFVRIGRHPHLLQRFIHIGRDGLVNEGGATGFGDDGDITRDDVDNDVMSKRQSSFVRIGKPMSNFVRIGKSNQDDDMHMMNDDMNMMNDDIHMVNEADADAELDSLLKRGSHFVRIGKGSHFVRIGKADSEEAGDSEDADIKRASRFVRIGKNLDQHMPDFPEGYPSFGYDYPAISQAPKRASRFVRIGKGDGDSVTTASKRGSNFVRIGKNVMSYFSKQPHSQTDFRPESRPQLDNSKRASRFVRIGKGAKQGLFSFLNSQQPAEDQPIHVSQRASAFVRIGKLPSSAFVRIGKSHFYEPRNRGSQSSSQIIRIGK